MSNMDLKLTKPKLTMLEKPIVERFTLFYPLTSKPIFTLLKGPISFPWDEFFYKLPQCTEKKEQKLHLATCLSSPATIGRGTLNC